MDLLTEFSDVREIGPGAFGSVLAAKKAVALKKIVIDERKIREDPSILESAKQEAVNLFTRYWHPNIVRCYCVFEDYAQNAIFIEMEWCSGVNLQTLLDEQGATIPKIWLPETQIRNWLSQLCRAITFMHDQKIAHRNIKPSNIFLSKDMSVVKIGDFGVAKLLDSLKVAPNGASHQRANAIMATVSHMAPEILALFVEPANAAVSSKTLADFDVGIKADAWALGVVLFEMMTLKTPYPIEQTTSSPHADLYWAIKRNMRSVIPGSYSDQMFAIVIRLLTTDSENRPTVREISRDPYFHSAQTPQPTPQPEATVSTNKLSRMARRNTNPSYLIAALRQAAEEGDIAKAEDAVNPIDGSVVELDALDEEGYTALMIASSNGHDNFLDWLLQRGADVDARSVSGWTSLMIATSSGHTETVRHLLRYGADTNVQDSRGWTCLMIAASSGYSEIVKVLLKNKKMATDLKNKEGKTAFDVAKTGAIKQLIQSAKR